MKTNRKIAQAVQIAEAAAAETAKEVATLTDTRLATLESELAQERSRVKLLEAANIAARKRDMPPMWLELVDGDGLPHRSGVPKSVTVLQLPTEATEVIRWGMPLPTVSPLRTEYRVVFEGDSDEYIHELTEGRTVRVRTEIKS